MEYTKDDVEAYVEYCAELYRMVVKAFRPDVPVDIKNMSNDMSDMMDKYMDLMEKSLSSTPLIMSIYNDLREPFNVWLYNDCPFTGHKAKISEMITLSASGNGRKHPKMTIDGRNPLMKNSKTDGLQEAIDELAGNHKRKKK